MLFFVKYLQSRFTLIPSKTKEDYRAQFTQMIQKRMTDIYHKAWKTTLGKTSGARDDYEAAKAFPPY